MKSALGDGPLRTLAEHAGLDEDEAAAHLAGLLPPLVDRLTPDGQVGEPGHEGGLAGALESIGGPFGDRG